MSKLFCKFICFFERMGRARAAAEFARQGKYDLARNLMVEGDCKC